MTKKATTGAVFDSVLLVELELDARGELSAHFALRASKTGMTYGKTSLVGREQFGEKTKKAIDKAIELMEEDAFHTLFPEETRKEEGSHEQKERSLGDAAGPENGSQL